MSIKDRLRSFQTRQNETLDVDLIPIKLAGLPPALEGFRIAVIADLHMPRIMPYHDKILEAVYTAQPECILIAGDTIDQTTGPIDALSPFFAMLSRMAPTVAILGNNDCLKGRIFSLREMYQSAGVTLLENETRLLNARGIPLQITGLSDPRAATIGILPEREEEKEYVPLTEALPPKEEKKTESILLPSILLLHRPQLVYEYMGLKPSLVIAGHAHGGQFRIGGRGLYAPDQGILPKLTSGLYTIDGTPLVVSRGLGNHEFPLRLNNPPHIPVAVLEKA